MVIDHVFVLAFLNESSMSQAPQINFYSENGREKITSRRVVGFHEQCTHTFTLKSDQFQISLASHQK